MTFHKISKVIVADVNKEEEAISKFRLSIAVADNDDDAMAMSMAMLI